MRAGPVATLILTVLLGACAGDQLRLFPGQNGNPTGGVAVLDPETGEDRAMIDQAGSKSAVNARGARVGRFDEAKLPEKDRSLLGFLPPAARSFVLDGFASEDTALSASQVAFIRSEVQAEIARRPGAEVVVIGHASRTGDEGFNDGISLARATAVRGEIARLLGIPADEITVAGRGYREPLPDVAPEAAANRRVEVVVR